MYCRNNFLPSLLHLPSSKLNDGEPRLNKAPNKKQHCDKRDEKHRKTDEDEEDNGDEDDDDLLKGKFETHIVLNGQNYRKNTIKCQKTALEYLYTVLVYLHLSGIAMPNVEYRIFNLSVFVQLNIFSYKKTHFLLPTDK